MSNNFKERFAERILSQERVLREYFKVYPGDEARLQKITNVLVDTLCFTDGKTEVCGREFLSSFTLDLGFQYWNFMHEDIEALYSAILRKPESWQNERAWILFAAVYLSSSSRIGPSVVSKIEMQYEGTSCKETYNILKNQGETPKNWLVHECLGYFANEGSFIEPSRVGDSEQPMVLARLGKFVGDGVREAIAQLARDEIRIAPVTEILSENSDFQFYSYSGDYDTFVPPSVYKVENAALQNGFTNYHYHNFSNSGHNGFAAEELVAEDLVRD